MRVIVNGGNGPTVGVRSTVTNGIEGCRPDTINAHSY
jgi:hypothetical protein